MGSIQATARLRIHEGRTEEFKSVAARCVEIVRTKDTGTLQYDWFLNDEGTECVVRETYSDSAAVFEHMGNLGDTLGDLLAVCHMELEVFGTPSEDLASTMREFGAQIYSPMS